MRIEEYGWRRIDAGGSPHPHSFERLAGTRIVSACVHSDGRAEVVAGVDDLVLLKSTGSEFHGFLGDRYTTLAPTDDRILATAVAARWRISAKRPTGRNASAARGRHWRRRSPSPTACRCSRPCTRWARPCSRPGRRCAEVRLSLPNKHHFLVDLDPFGLDNPGEVFYAADRPYGLIEGTVCRADAPAGDPEHQW